MDNIISSTLLPGVVVSGSEKPSVALPEQLPQGVKPGDVLMLEILSQTDTFKSGDLVEMVLQGQGKEESLINIKLQTPLKLEGQAGEPRVVAAKVMADGSLQLLPAKAQAGQTEQTTQTIRSQNLITNNITNKLPQAEFQPIKVLPAVENLMSELEFPLPLKEAVIRELPPAEIMVALKGLGQGDILDKSILEPLKEILRQMPEAAAKPQELKGLVQDLAQTIKNLSGKSFEAQISTQQQQSTATVFESPLGKIWSEQPLKLPADTILQLEVKNTQVSEPMSWLKGFAEDIAKLLPAKEFARIEPEVLLKAMQTKNDRFQGLLKVLEPLVAKGNEVSNQTAAAVLQKLPGMKADVLQNMHGLYRAAVQKDSKLWLGDVLSQQITTETPKGAETIARLDSFVSSLVRETPQWRIIELPFFDAQMLQPLQIALKKEPEEEKKKQAKSQGIRFVVNTEFTKLGAFQFDGFSVAEKRRFDLVIRTSLPQAEDFCAAIMNLFKKSLHDVDYNGTIKINQREAFIKVESAEATREGMYV